MNMPKRHFMKSRWASVNEIAAEFVDGTSPAELNVANGNAQSRAARTDLERHEPLPNQLATTLWALLENAFMFVSLNTVVESSLFVNLNLSYTRPHPDPLPRGE